MICQGHLLAMKRYQSHFLSNVQNVAKPNISWKGYDSIITEKNVMPWEILSQETLKFVA